MDVLVVKTVLQVVVVLQLLDQQQVELMVELEVLKTADLLRAEGLLQHCLESFRVGMTVATAVEELVWAHQEGPAEAREMATDFFLRNRKAIRVRV